MSLLLTHKPFPSAMHIMALVGLLYGVTTEEMTGRRRTRVVARARQMSMALMRELTPMSLREIGAHFGRGHDTALHGCRRITATENPKIANAFRLLKSKLTS